MSIKSHRLTIIITIKSNAKPDPGGVNYGDYGTIIIEDFLGDSNQFQIVKSVLSPMASFILTLPDKPYPQSNGVPNDSLYGLIQSMDFIEVRMTHNPTTIDNIPIMMRGLILGVTRQEIIDAQGHPQRAIVFRGNDLGYMFNIIRIMPPLVDFSVLGLALSGNQLAESLGITGSNGVLTIKDFYSKILDKVNAIMMDANSPIDLNGNPVQFKLDCQVSTNTGIYINYWDPANQQIWTIMVDYLDSMFHEMYVEDREDGTYLVIRPKPFIDYINDQWIQIDDNTAPTLDIIEVDISEIAEITADRDDDTVYNYILLQYNSIALSQESKLVEALKYSDSQKFQDYQNCKVDIYGYRPLIKEFVQVPVSIVSPLTLQKESQVEANLGYIDEWAKKRMTSLFNMNKDNVILDYGTMTLFGNHKIKPGVYLHITRGLFDYIVYVETVTQDLSPFHQYLTKVSYVRGNGFIKRMKSPQPPYLSEGRKGVY